MSLAKLNKHSWKEYQWRFANDNKQPRRMWVRDDDRIFEVDDNMFQTANNTHWHDGQYNTFAEAEKMLDAAND